MRKNVLLIMPDLTRYDEYQWIPTNLLFLATVLKSKGYSPIIVDDRIQSRKRTLEIIDQNINNTLLIGLSVTCGNQLHHTLQIVKYIKENKYDVPIVVGGAMPSAVPEIMLSDENIDYAISGQGEYSICSLCDAIEANDIKMLNEIPNLYFKFDGDVLKSPALFKKINIENMPPLCYDDPIIDISKYINPDTRTINYNTSVGCIGNCSFCYFPINYYYSHFSNDRVISDLKYLIKMYKLRNITFDDPTFFVNRKLTMDLVKKIIDEKLNVKWRANGRVDTLKKFTSDDIDLIAKSGCHLIHIGMESGSERILKLMNKNINVKDGLKLIEKFADKDIHIRFHFILGIPTEELNDIELTAEFIEKVKGIKNDFDYTVNIFTPYPGNQLTFLAEKCGYILPKTLTDYINVETLNFKEYKAESGSPLPCIWDIEYALPWFNEEFNKKHMECFHELIPRVDSIVSVDNKKYKFSSKNKE